MNRRIVGGVLAAVVVLAQALACVAQADVKVSGYSQARYNFWDSSQNKNNEFDLRRVRVKFASTLNDAGTEAVVQVDLSKLDDAEPGRVVLKDAFIRHPLNQNWAARLGYGGILFGFEVEYSSSKRLPLERSRAENMLFPDEKGNGLYLMYKPTEPGRPCVEVGYTNGVQKWRETDDKDVAALIRIHWPLERGGDAGVSFLRGSRTQTTEIAPAVADAEKITRSYDNNVWGAHVRWIAPRNWALQGEYYNGQILANDVSGWYAKAEFTPTGANNTWFYRYDAFDYGTPGDSSFGRHTLGWAWDLHKNERLTIQFESLADKGAKADNVGVQWQVKY